MAKVDGRIIDYLYRREGQTLRILHPDTLEEVGFVTVPENFTLADLEKFRDHLLKLADDIAKGPN